MTEILPGILETSFDGVRQKCARLQGIVARAQLDIADGVFVPEKTWQHPDDLDALAGGLRFDAHLMAERPEALVGAWNKEAVFRLTFHAEASYDIRRTIALIKETGKEVGIALNLDTEVASIYDILPEVDLVLIMGIEPGAQGREFNPRAVDKVRELRRHSPNTAIGVDGGITPLVAGSVVAAGASVLVSGSYLFGEEDIASAIKALRGDQMTL